MNKWVKASAKAYKYTYTAVLSLRDGEMEPSDFINAMREQKQFQEFRLIRHTDTDRDHAHVMAFRNKTLTRAEFNDWRHTVGDELQMYEYYRIQNQSAERAAERKLELENRRREKEKQLQEEWELGRGRSAGLGL